MSELSDSGVAGDRNGSVLGDSESDSYDTRQRYSSDEEEDEEDGNDDDLRRDGFLVDDDEEEEDPDEEERRRRRRRRRKKRRMEQAAGEAGDNDTLDEEDLALVAENTYGAQTPEETGGARFKRLKRGRGPRVGADSELRAELDDLIGGGPEQESPQDDELGLFGDEDGYGARREASVYDELDDPEAELEEEAAVGARGAMPNFLGEGAEGLDDETWAELHDIFGTGEEYAFAMEAGARREAPEAKTLAEVFEPAELEAKMMTQRDEDIRTTDIPERMQMRAEGSGAEQQRPLTEEEIEEETTWVVRQVHRQLMQHQDSDLQNPNDNGDDDDEYGAGSPAAPFPHADFNNERFLAAVLSVLKLLSQDFYEVPYIAQHRREVFVTAARDEGSGDDEESREWLTHDDLWRLYDYDQQFRALLGARRQVLNTVRRLRGEGTEASEPMITNTDAAYAEWLIGTASSVEEVADVGEWLHERYAAVMRGWARAGGQKRTATLGVAEQMERDGTADLVAQMHVSARQVGAGLVDVGLQGDGPPAEPPVEFRATSQSPLDAAQALVGQRFISADLALRAAATAWGRLVALDPLVRRRVRSQCASAAVIVRPTARGLREVTHEDHPAFAFKFLKQKPVSAFNGSAQFAELQRAADGGLVRLAFSLTSEYRFSSSSGDNDDDAVFAEDARRTTLVVARVLEPHVQRGDAWDTVRTDALRDAVETQLLPQMWREVAQHARQAAFDVVADACRRGVARRVAVGAPTRDSELRSDVRPRVVVVAGGGFAASARGALRIVAVDEHGECRETQSADSMRSGGDGESVLRAVVERHEPDVVAVAGMAIQTRRLFDDTRAVVGDTLDVMYATDEAARLWCDGDAARAELPALRKEERYCVGVARTLQDPAAAYAALGDQLLALPLHRAQRAVDQNALMRVAERALVDVVNSVGVDVNDAVAHVHRRALLPHISGLGPRKAQAIVSKLTTLPLESRSDLIVRRLCTRTVFVNCASFLRVRPPAIDVLDDTRVHPEDYDLARKMALDALDVEDDDDDDPRRRRRGPSRYVAELMRDAPERLDDLDLDKYAAELTRLLDVHKLETLKFIHRELQHPNADPRAPHEPMSDAQLLYMLTGETVGHSLKEDGSCLVSATIMRVQPRFAIARLDSGLDGFINVANIADYHVEEAADELAPGQTVVAVVKRIDLDRMSLDLTMRPADVAAATRRHDVDPRKVDRYFDLGAEAQLRERARAQKAKSSARMRSIPHPLFKPFNGREAEQYLAARPLGDCVIRPSSRGLDHIAITWKVGDGLFQHIDVREEGKPNPAALGTSFIVGDMAYTDLDELVALHVDPIVRKLDEVRRSPKFYDPERDPLYAREPLEEVLGGPNDYSSEYRERRLELWETRVSRHLDTLAQSTGRGAYCIALSLSKPGSLALAFKPTPDYRGIIKWTARVEPSEYRLGDRGRYPNITGLVNGFKVMQMKAPKRPADRQDHRHSRPERDHRPERPSRGATGGGGWGGTNSWDAPPAAAGSGWNA
ncbi:Transcription elongation factor spt6 [Coemansia sp. RSA 552]|nr:Transcription elongation factor spt6 [Coemansia sp. RSA 552]